MIVHYNLTLIKTDVVLKITYRSGKFRKLEKLKGTLKDEQLWAIGKVIPPTEARISEFNVTFNKSVLMEPILAQKTNYSQFTGAWFEFYKEFTGLDYVFSGIDGKSTKQIISKLTAMCKDEGEAFQLWKIILNTWKDLDKFHHQHTDLKYINSQLNVLLNAIKQNTSNQTEVFARAMESDTARNYKFK